MDLDTVERGGRRAVLRGCPLCGDPSAAAPATEYSDPTWTMRRCAACGFVYLDAAPVYEELVREHSWDKTAVSRHAERRRRHPFLYWLSKSSRWRLHLFKRKQVEALLAQFVADGNVIDIGCGKGSQLMKLPERYVPFGVEISEVEAAHATEWAGRRGGAIVVKPATEGLASFAEDFAAGIIMRSYLEHELDPRAVLEQAHRVLRPDGVVIIKVPNFGCWNRTVLGEKWSGFRFPDHLNYFTPQTLQRMCEEAGFVVRRFGFMDRFPLGDNMWLIAGKRAATA